MPLDPENGTQVGLPSSMHYANGWPLFQRGDVILAAMVIFRFFIAVVILKYHYDGWCHIVVAVNSNARTFLEQVIASIICNSRCRMSDVAFRTAPPIGGHSCSI